MREDLKNEIKLFLMYLSIAMVSGLIGFVLFVYPSQEGDELANNINLIEAWKQYRHLFQLWLLFFVIGGVIRLIFVGFFKKR